MSEKPVVYHPEWGVIRKPDDFDIRFLNPKNPDSLINYNPIIILGGSLQWLEEGATRVNETVKREREIFNALENGSVVCFVFRYDELFERVLKRIYMKATVWEQPRVDFVIKRSEWSPFLKRFGSAHFDFEGAFDDVICRTQDDSVVGFAEKVGNGALIFLPCWVHIAQFKNARFLDEFLLALFDALRKYVPRIQYKPPNWIDSYRFPKEATIVAELGGLQEKINKRTDALEGYLGLKEILWFRNDELVDSVISFFNELGIETLRDEIYEEDFWIIERRKETVIVEVKGLDKNLKRPHISQLDEHRGARERPDDFPALLVVNSFNRAKSLKEKDKAISSNEIKKAVRTNVLIMRTLDLCNAYALVERMRLNVKTLLDVMKSEAGWLRITPSEYEIKKE